MRVAEKDFEISLWSQTLRIMKGQGKDSTVQYRSEGKTVTDVSFVIKKTRSRS